MTRPITEVVTPENVKTKKLVDLLFSDIADGFSIRVTNLVITKNIRNRETDLGLRLERRTGLGLQRVCEQAGVCEFGFVRRGLDQCVSMISDSNLSSKLAFATRSTKATTTATASGVRSRHVSVAQSREELENFPNEPAGGAPLLGFGKISSRSTRGLKLNLGFLNLIVGMALLSLTLVTLLTIFHSSAVEGAKELVTYGSVIKLQHERTKARLHSHDVPYGSGSGQQSVTAFPGVEDANSYWRVEIVDDDHKQGNVIPNGAVIRLQHARTRKWLHSRQVHRSPLSGNLEVSARDDEETDTGDYWKLEIQGTEREWTLDQKVRLRHVDTDGYLHSHKMMYDQLNQQEVCGVTKKSGNNLWSAAEGVYFRPRGSSSVE